MCRTGRSRGGSTAHHRLPTKLGSAARSRRGRVEHAGCRRRRLTRPGNAARGARSAAWPIRGHRCSALRLGGCWRLSMPGRPTNRMTGGAVRVSHPDRSLRPSPGRRTRVCLRGRLRSEARSEARLMLSSGEARVLIDEMGGSAMRVRRVGRRRWAESEGATSLEQLLCGKRPFALVLAGEVARRADVTSALAFKVVGLVARRAVPVGLARGNVRRAKVADQRHPLESRREHRSKVVAVDALLRRHLHRRVRHLRPRLHHAAAAHARAHCARCRLRCLWHRRGRRSLSEVAALLTRRRAAHLDARRDGRGRRRTFIGPL